MTSLSPLDSFMPQWDIRERHTTRVRAPAAQVYRVARDLDIQSVAPVRAIIELREKLLRSAPSHRVPQGFIDEMRALGWGTLIEKPGHLFVAGSACQPWLPNVGFTPISPERFRSFSEPGRVKIVWSLELSSTDGLLTEFATETRAIATDADARTRFLRYWQWARIGIVLIRWMLLGAIRRRAEQQWRALES